MKAKKSMFILLAIMLMLTACFSKPAEQTEETQQNTSEEQENESNSPEEDRYGGNLHILLTTDADTLDPHRSSSYYTHAMLGLVYSKLLMRDPSREGNRDIMPDLAESWDISPDNVTYTFHLRKNAKWHNVPPVNGRNVVADDVIATMERIQTLPGHQKSLLAMVESMEAPDDHTVVFHLSQPYAPFLNNMADHFTWILPREATEGKIDLNTQAIGSGPFILTERKPNVESKFTKNPDYYIEGRPYLDGVIAPVVNDQDARIAQFRTGNAENVGLVPVEQLELIKRAIPDLKVYEQLSATYIQFFMNINKEPFNDAKVRKAIAMAINKKGAIEKLYAGGGEVSSPVNPSLGDWALPLEEREKLQPFDMEKAKALLAEAGYPNGFKTKFLISNGYGVPIQRMAEWMIEDLKAIGVTAELEITDHAAFTGQRMPNGEFDIGITYETWFQEADSWLYNIYHSNGTKNYSGISDSKLDEMIESQRNTLDEKKRKEIVHDAQRYILENAAGPIPLITTVSPDPVQPYLHNWGLSRAEYGLTFMKDVWLDKNR